MKQNSLEKRFIDVLQEFVVTKSFVLAVSGGVDSMVMLDLFVKYCKKPFKVAYFDHKIRNDTAREIEMIRSVCREKDVTFELGVADIPAMVGNLEANARKMRYEFLESIRPDDAFVVTAHHQDDQVETVFINFLKGSFVAGLAGLARIDESRHLWRPLVGFSKAELLVYSELNNIQFIEDSTNVDTKYFRNFLRGEIIPVLTEKLGSMSVIARNADFYSELGRYLDQQIEVFFESKFINGKIERKFIKELPSFLRFKLYQKLAHEYDLSVADFLELDEVVIHGVTGKKRMMGEVEFVINKGMLIVN